MRKLATPLVLLLAAAALAMPRAAAAQYQIRSTESAPAARDSVQRAQFEAVKDDLRTLIRSQEAYFQAHGRYAGELTDLPEFRLRPDTIVSFTAGDNWYVALGGGFAVGIQQVVVWRDAGKGAPSTAAPR